MVEHDASDYKERNSIRIIPKNCQNRYANKRGVVRTTKQRAVTYPGVTI